MTGDHRQTLINKYLVRGSVWKALQTFSSGQPPKEKFFVVIAKEPNFVSYLMPTSKGDYFKKVKDCCFVCIPVGTYDFFSLETFVGCDQIYMDRYERFRSLFDRRKIEYVGQIEPQLLAELDRQLKKSKRLSPQEKSRLFPVNS